MLHSNPKPLNTRTLNVFTHSENHYHRVLSRYSVRVSRLIYAFSCTAQCETVGWRDSVSTLCICWDGLISVTPPWEDIRGRYRWQWTCDTQTRKLPGATRPWSPVNPVVKVCFPLPEGGWPTAQRYQFWLRARKAVSRTCRGLKAGPGGLECTESKAKMRDNRRRLMQTAVWLH